MLDSGDHQQLVRNIIVNQINNITQFNLGFFEKDCKGKKNLFKNAWIGNSNLGNSSREKEIARNLSWDGINLASLKGYKIFHLFLSSEFLRKQEFLIDTFEYICIPRLDSFGSRKRCFFERFFVEKLKTELQWACMVSKCWFVLIETPKNIKFPPFLFLFSLIIKESFFQFRFEKDEIITFPLKFQSKFVHFYSSIISNKRNQP